MNFPVFSQLAGNFGFRDGFARDSRFSFMKGKLGRYLASSARRLDESRAARDMAGHLADRPRVVSVIGEPGIGSVPVGEQRRSGLHVGPHKGFDRSRGVVRDGGEPDTTRPSIQVFRSFPPWLGLVGAAVDDLDSASDKGSSRISRDRKSCCRPGTEFRPGRPPPRPLAARAADRSSIVGASAPATKRSCT